MDFQKLTLAALVAALMFSPAQANQEKDEEEKDSVTEWGPWALPLPTAAGPEVAINPLLFTGGSGPEHVFFDPDLDLPIVNGLCSPGEFCGFTEFYEWDDSFQFINGDYGDYGYEMDVGLFDLRVDPSFFTPDGAEGGGSTIGGFSVLGNEGYEFSGDGAEGHHWAGHGHLHDYIDSDSDIYIRVEYDPSYDDDHPALIFGWWSENDYSRESYDGAEGYFVGGITTTLAQLNGFVSSLNGAIAEYSGYTLDYGHFDIAINFDAGSWSGEWESSDYNDYDDFTVTNGNVSGINFTAASANLGSEGGYPVTGLVAGAIIGAEAESVAGLVDIEKDLGEGVVQRETIFASGYHFEDD